MGEPLVSKKRVDLNLFRVFDAIMLHRSVSGASRDLGVTPSAVSHALARLRQALGDQLFVGGEGGMEPTARALELAPRIRGGLGLIDEAIDITPFVPADSTRTFRIAATEYGTVAILAPVIGRLIELAPNIELRVFPYSRLDTIRHLDDGRIDLVLGWFHEIPERMIRAQIREEHEAVVVRSDHPLTQGQVTLERLFSFPMLIVELTGTEKPGPEGFMDDRGLQRRVWMDRLLLEMGGGDKDVVGKVTVSLPYYAAVPAMLRATDMVATLPLSMARKGVKRGELAILDLPYEPLTVRVEAVLHQRSERDPGLQWLIGQLGDATGGSS